MTLRTLEMYSIQPLGLHRHVKNLLDDMKLYYMNLRSTSNTGMFSLDSYAHLKRCHTIVLEELLSVKTRMYISRGPTICFPVNARVRVSVYGKGAEVCVGDAGREGVSK